MSFGRLSPFKWKGLINTNKPWTFEGSLDNGKQLQWSFRSSYQLLFYYRHR